MLPSRLHLPLIISSLLCLNNCAQWPDAGRGGMAEDNLGNLITVENQYALTVKHGLRFDFGQLKNHLDILILQGAQWCFPAAVNEAQLREGRIARELRGQFFEDAEVDVLIQRQHLASLERRLNKVLREASCVPPNDSAEAAVVHADTSNGDSKAIANISNSNTLTELLNSDNQFATNSAIINPKYAERLRTAALQLKDQAQVQAQQLTITGHADRRGTNAFNATLSQARANAVARFLVDEGIEEHRITVIAKGAQAPLYEGNNSAVWLVNRAVTIELSLVKVQP